MRTDSMDGGQPNNVPPPAKVPNDLVDAALGQIREKMVQQGYTELLLPPSENEFSEKILGVTWHGTLILTNGKLRGLETLHRVGDAALSFNEFVNNRGQYAEITFTVDLGLTAPTTTNDFRLIFMNREMHGVLTGSMSTVIFTIVLGLGILTRKMRLIDLKFKELGELSIDIKGLGVVLDFLASKITKIMLNRTKWDMATMAEGKVKIILSEIVDNMKCPMPDQQNLLIGGMQSAFGGGADGGGAGTSSQPSTSKKGK